MTQKALAKIRLLQMNSGEDPVANARWILKHLSQSVDLVIAPENALFCGRSSELDRAVTNIEKDALPELLKGWGKNSSSTPLVLGGVPRRMNGSSKYHNQWLVLRDGVWNSSYVKNHLFTADVPGQRTYNETERFDSGTKDELLSFKSSSGFSFRVGASTCFDVRFPEMFRKYALAGAHVLAVPSAFTKLTGEAHWHILLRARAIENQCFVVAPAQVGSAPGDRMAYGHSIAIDPWGKVLVDAEEKVGAFDVTLDFMHIDEVRRRVGTGLEKISERANP